MVGTHREAVPLGQDSIGVDDCEVHRGRRGARGSGGGDVCRFSASARGKEDGEQEDEGAHAMDQAEVL